LWKRLSKQSVRAENVNGEYPGDDDRLGSLSAQFRIRYIHDAINDRVPALNIKTAKPSQEGFSAMTSPASLMKEARKVSDLSTYMR
jgi:hypothetical protein